MAAYDEVKSRRRLVPARAAACAGVLALLCSAYGFAAPAAPEGVAAPRVDFEKFTLSNGLQVILHVDRTAPVVHVNQWYHVGSKDEQPRRTGFAHLFEHMMYQGSKHAPEEYFGYAGQAGANLFAGGLNGTTDQDRTNYFATVPSANLEYLLWLEADRLATLPEALTQAKLDNEREIVRNERRESFENQPYGLVSSLVTENLYPPGHPYSWSIIGSHADLSAASLDEMREFFRRYYTPNNLSLAITGDFAPAEARRLVEKYFGGIAPGPAIPRRKRWVPRLEGEKIVEVTDRVAQARVYMVWPSPPLFETGDAELELAAAILSDGLSARLQRKLTYESNLATQVAARQSAGEIAGLFAISVTARANTQLPQIERMVSEEIARLAGTGPTPQELQRVKVKHEYRFISDLEDIGAGGKAGSLNSYNTYLGDPGGFARDLARYNDASASTVRSAVDRWLNTRDRLIVRVQPESHLQPTVQPDLDRSKPPALGADRPFVAPQVGTARLENGLELFVIERPELPKVALTLVTHAGAIVDPPDRAGLAYLTTKMLRRGSRGASALEVEDAFGALGASLSDSVGRESSQLSLQVLKRNLNGALRMFADLARQPTFPEDEIAREKALQLDRLAQESSNPKALAARLGEMLVFGQDHPYGRPRTGSAASLGSISRSELLHLYETWWQPGGSALIFAGDITLEEATRLAREYFGSWSGRAPPVPSVGPAQPMGPGQVFVVDRPGSAQTLIEQLLPGAARGSDDYYALSLANTVWGGGFQSRLMKNLREEKGYSYGIYSMPTSLRQAGAWIASGGVQADKTKESIVELNAELANLAGRMPISASELADAKANRVRGYAQEFRTMNQMVAQLAELWSLGLPTAETQRFADRMSQATLSSVNQVARRYAASGPATLLLVGDYAKMAADLVSLGFKHVTVLDTGGGRVADHTGISKPEPVSGSEGGAK